jgi:DNA-binding response OmpR family regulator
VTLLFPRASQLPAAIKPGPDRPSGELEKGRGTKVLLIDDDDDVRAWLCEALREQGYHIEEAHDGPTGLAKLNASRPDLVLLDFAMPGMNGAEVARHIRTAAPTLPIIIATGYADTAALDGVLGATTVLLRKPFAGEELAALIRNLLDAAAAPGSADAAGADHVRTAAC